MTKLGTGIVLAALIAAPAWGQQPSNSKDHNDQLVQMRLEIQEARNEYNRKVKEAAKERDAAIAAARAKAGQK